MGEAVRITRPDGPLRADILLPRSKSVSNRALIMASLIGDIDLVKHPSDGDDTRVLHELLRERPRVMDCGAGGTTFRFLLAWASVQAGEEHVITGIPRLLDRPHGDLVEALRTLGARIEKVPEGFKVTGSRMKGGEVHFDSPISSQYLSALLLIAPCLEEGLTLRWTGTRLSEPFVSMTLMMLAHFGVFPRLEMDGVHVAPGMYDHVEYTVPPDWSSAAFWFEQVALDPGADVLLQGLFPETLQGDREAIRLWEPWVLADEEEQGLRLTHRSSPLPWPAHTIDLKHVPDLFQPLAFTAAARGVSAAFSGLDNLVVKETDRLKAVASALHRMGGSATHVGGSFALSGPITRKESIHFDPDIDHRMALSTAPLALVLPEVTIGDPRVVEKSYPGYWADLERVGYTILRTG